MEKRKVFKISIIDKEISRTEFDRNTFYTSDSELSLVFKLIEKDYSYEHGEILLYNENDNSFVTRKITKQDNDFVYELDLDIIPHFGKWQAQLQLVNDGDVYTSKPFNFSIVNDLSNLAPQPTLTDINNWATLKQSANELIDEMRDVIVDVEHAESERENNEKQRQIDEFERVDKENKRQQAESQRVNQENTRQQSESKRENNEKQRRISEFERVENETTRQQAESKRQSTFEKNETERQTTFETAEQSRQSAELIRVENEKQRNLTSVDEFIKLQNAVGGRNYFLKSDVERTSTREFVNNIYWDMSPLIDKFGIDTYYTVSFDIKSQVSGIIRVYAQNGAGTEYDVPPKNIEVSTVYQRFSHTFKPSLGISTETKTVLAFFGGYGTGRIPTVNNVKFEVGEDVTPYTKAPEDYTVVSKDDYYNHVKLMKVFKDIQFNQLRKAVIALGGTI